MNQWMDCYAPLMGRILLGGYFLWNGVLKVVSFPTVVAVVAASGFPLPTLAVAVALLLEAGLGLAVVVGYGARVAGIGLAVYTTVVTLIFHASVDPNQTALFLKNVAIVGGLLYLSAYGAGRWSLEHKRPIM